MAKRHGNRLGDLESLFMRLEELVLANSGEDEFEEVFKLLVAKLWAERNETSCEFAPQSDPEATTATVIRLLREAEKGWPGVLEPDAVPLLTPDHLQVCVEALAVHRISDRSLEVLDSFFEFMVARAAKGSKGQYFTPRFVIELCVRMMAPTSQETVVDPACGSGGFLMHAFEWVCRNEQLSGAAVAKYAKRNLWGFDIDARAIRVAKTLMILAGDGSANLVRLNSLLTPEEQSLFPSKENESPSMTVEDVMRSRTRRHKGFDVILTNPPFAGEVRERQVLDTYDVSRGRNRVERDVLFIERCIRLLSPGGRMAMVLPHNKFAANEFGDVRRWVDKSCRVLGVVSLGRNTFLPHTHQKASILFLQRRHADQPASDKDPVFFAISERAGKNSKGQLVFKDVHDSDAPVWDRVDHDFDEIVGGFAEFCHSESVVMGA